MKPVTYLTVTESATFFLGSVLIFPLFAILAAWAARQISGYKEQGIIRTFTHLAYMFLPVGLAMHLAHNVSHLITEGPGVISALQRTLTRYTGLEAGEPDWQFMPLVSSDAIYGLQILLILLGFIFSLNVGYRLTATLFDRQETAGKAFIPFAALSLVFTLINLYLLNQPMGARHAM
jgi:hypothetical protein